MRDTQHTASTSVIGQIPREIVTIAGTAAAIFGVVAIGGLIASSLPEGIHSPWLVMASYATPAAVAFVIHWWISQRR